MGTATVARAPKIFWVRYWAQLMNYSVHFEVGSKNDDEAMPEKRYTILKDAPLCFF